LAERGLKKSNMIQHGIYHKWFLRFNFSKRIHGTIIILCKIVGLERKKEIVGLERKKDKYFSNRSIYR
jgi:hypothetical protein